MRSGRWLWLRHHRVPQCVAACLTAAALTRALITLSSEGGNLEVGPLWVSMAATIPLLFMFTHEGDAERTSPRSLLHARGTLLGVALGTTALVSLASFPHELTDLGALATWRNCVALLGLGLVGMSLIGRAAIWVLPSASGVLSMLFAWPWRPTLFEGVWGALRAPGSFTFESNDVLNLSIPVCLIVGAIGAAAYLRGVTHDQLTAHRLAVAIKTPDTDALERWKPGMRRASLQAPILAASIVFCGAIMLTTVSTWGGSPRLLLGNALPGWFFIVLPVGTVIGIVQGQARWRSGVTTWQTLSPRSTRQLLARSSGRAMVTTVVGLGLPLLALGLLSAVTLALSSTSALAIREFASGLPSAMLVLAAAAVLAAAGSFVGWYTSRIWVAPLGLLVSLALMIAVPLELSRGADVDGVWSKRYGYTSCVTSPMHDLTVCTTPPNTAFLPAAVTTLNQIYSDSAHPEALPRLVDLNSRAPLGRQAAGSMEAPIIAIQRHRGLTPPTNLDGAADALAYSTSSWCPAAELSDIQQLYGLNPTEANTTMRHTLQALKTCRQRG